MDDFSVDIPMNNNKALRTFLSEVHERIGKISKIINNSSPKNNYEELYEAFRLIHPISSLASFLNQQEIEITAHSIEMILNTALQQKPEPLSENQIKKIDVHIEKIKQNLAYQKY